MKQGKGPDKKNATKKRVNKTAASGSSDGNSSAESSAPEEGTFFQSVHGKDKLVFTIVSYTDVFSVVEMPLYV